MCVFQGEIGWRNVSRRMLVFSTDAGFHYAGDGKVNLIVVLLSSLPPPPSPQKQSRERYVMCTKSMVKILEVYSATKTVHLRHEMLVGHSKLSACLFARGFCCYFFLLLLPPNSDQIFSMMKEITLRKEMHLEDVVSVILPPVAAWWHCSAQRWPLSHAQQHLHREFQPGLPQRLSDHGKAETEVSQHHLCSHQGPVFHLRETF